MQRIAMILFDFLCKCGHVNEKLVPRETKQIDCPQCDEVAKRVISAVRCSLDPASGHFPGATDKWVRSRQQKMELERKAAEQ
jgi:hypothetical protein